MSMHKNLKTIREVAKSVVELRAKAVQIASECMKLKRGKEVRHADADRATDAAYELHKYNTLPDNMLKLVDIIEIQTKELETLHKSLENCWREHNSARLQRGADESRVVLRKSDALAEELVLGVTLSDKETT